jgi:hypothetical protein
MFKKARFSLSKASETGPVKIGALLRTHDDRPEIVLMVSSVVLHVVVLGLEASNTTDSVR